ncbi:hypothetical protein SY1_06820 [Fretibacterium fastidiosum]|uniref:Uncharacterized protein n=1 Tax=Fretibacterium fastidiosum TaxID=651822 RepID=A0AB94IWB7_9BACT|nr:hypothetical protein SY1_06820 [Fretibacterium fastidiosum]
MEQVGQVRVESIFKVGVPAAEAGTAARTAARTAINSAFIIDTSFRSFGPAAVGFCAPGREVRFVKAILQ